MFFFWRSIKVLETVQLLQQPVFPLCLGCFSIQISCLKFSQFHWNRLSHLTIWNAPRSPFFMDITDRHKWFVGSLLVQICVVSSFSIIVFFKVSKLLFYRGVTCFSCVLSTWKYVSNNHISTASNKHGWFMFGSHPWVIVSSLSTLVSCKVSILRLYLGVTCSSLMCYRDSNMCLLMILLPSTQSIPKSMLELASLEKRRKCNDTCQNCGRWQVDS